MRSSFPFGSRLAHDIALSGLLCVALAASAARACPPGTMPDPNYDPSSPAARAHPQRCVAAPKPSTARYVGSANPDIEHAVQPHSPTSMRQDRSKLEPRPGVPIEHAGSAADTHGIIFVGGKSALNMQPIPSGKAALNPQPIPPGHTLRHAPPRGTPVEKAESH